ncbi:hypothetical protein BU204_02535 [Actinophytocola xanthii]|uniref:Uncharacterized protein n=2 Tax=Actinophytocola xanthii TaxID=1912961 RepID=A0A1Q8CY15_9PSEU|nr:hypothetical protein BU204_02535 [Actinophytocola xanthii]
MLVAAILRRYSPLVYGALGIGLVLAVVTAFLPWTWLQFLTVGLLIAGIGMFNGESSSRKRARSASE